MYSLLVLLGLLTATAFLHTFVFGRRRYLPVLVVALVLMLYTHNWSLFFYAGLIMALIVISRKSEDKRQLRRDGLMAFGAVALLYAPWIPTLVFQTFNTGAPWSNVPTVSALWTVLSSGLLGGLGPAVLLLVIGAGIGLAGTLRARSEVKLCIYALLALTITTVVLAWIGSQFAPAWATRYMAVIVGPLILVAAIALSRAGRIGLVFLVAILAFWVGHKVPVVSESSERSVAVRVAPLLRSGDLVVSTQPERVPVLSYYFQDDLKHASLLGPVGDTRIMDWRGALGRIKLARVETDFKPLLTRIPAGGRVAVVRPIFRPRSRRRAPWIRIVRRRSEQWDRAIAHDPGFRRVSFVPENPDSFASGVMAIVYERRR